MPDTPSGPVSHKVSRATSILLTALTLALLFAASSIISNNDQGERLNVNYEHFSPHQDVLWDGINSVALQRSEPLGSSAMRWILPPVDHRNEDANAGSIRDGAAQSFRDQMERAFPGVTKYPSVRWHGPHLSVDCADTVIKPVELINKARDFCLAGLTNWPLGLPFVMGTTLPTGVAVVTFKNVDGVGLPSFLRVVAEAVLEGLRGPNEKYVVHVVDAWRRRRGLKALNAGWSTKEISLVVKVYESVPVSRAGPDAVTYDEVLDSFQPSRPSFSAPGSRRLQLVDSIASPSCVWPGWLMVGGRRYQIEYPGRFNYCTNEACIDLNSTPQHRHTSEECSGDPFVLDNRGTSPPESVDRYIPRPRQRRRYW